jgi:hypothetical protein
MDITKCKGDGCPVKERCYRFTAKADVYQSYFADIPLKDGKCDEFWGENNQEIHHQLKEMVGSK